jgi:hypothetical protein
MAAHSQTLAKRLMECTFECTLSYLNWTVLGFNGVATTNTRRRSTMPRRQYNGDTTHFFAVSLFHAQGRKHVTTMNTTISDDTPVASPSLLSRQVTSTRLHRHAPHFPVLVDSMNLENSINIQPKREREREREKRLPLSSSLVHVNTTAVTK